MTKSQKEVMLEEIDDVIEGHWARRIEADIPLEDFNEVIPGIFIGDKTIAMDKEKLLELGVTHVLNAAMGSTMDQIDSSAQFFEDANIRFHGVCVNDTPSCKLAPHFVPAAEFIDAALKEGGKVFVHCMLGMSRSTSLLLAYLMLRRSMELMAAIKLLQETRPMDINSGFLAELCDLHLSLRGHR